MKFRPLLLSVALAALASADAAPPPLSFRDVGRDMGIFPAIEGMHAHGAAWGDVDGDSFPDLFVGTFHKPDSKPCMLFRNRAGKSFAKDPGRPLQFSGRVTGVVFADLDNDGDLDLYVASMPKKAGRRSPLAMRGCSLFRNDGKGQFTDVSAGNGACPEAFGGRSAAVLDFDGDGLLDLAVAEDPIKGYNGSTTASSRLFRNLGGLTFKDVSSKAGIPADTPGLGIAAADVNNDSWPDLYIAAQGGGNILLLNTGKGSFTECPGTRDLFAWPEAGGDNMVCGICFGDVNRDGLQDLVVGQHFEKPWQSPVANRLYLNMGIKDGVPRFKNVSRESGLLPLPMKAPHVEIQDFDNDGWPDIASSVVKFDAEGVPHPVVFRHHGLKNGLPRFTAPALQVNDFPAAEDTSIQRTGEFFDRMIAERQIIYTAPGPVADYNRDGRLDLFLGSWWKEAPSMLLRNESKTGNWIRIRFDFQRPKLNRAGIGARVKVYPPGKLGDPAALLGAREIATGYGYASGQPPVTHFGLGDLTHVDVRVTLPHNGGVEDFPGLRSGQEITLGR